MMNTKDVMTESKTLDDRIMMDPKNQKALAIVQQNIVIAPKFREPICRLQITILRLEKEVSFLKFFITPNISLTFGF